MTANNDFLALANGGGANVISQATYAGATALLANGYQAGLAQSAQVNKTFRQATAIAALIGQFIQTQGFDANDDGNAFNLLTSFQQAIQSFVGQPNVFTGGTTTGSANAQVLATINPSTGFGLNNGFTVVATAGFTNTGSTTINVHATGATLIQKLSGGVLVNLASSDLTLGNNFTIEYNSTAAVWVLQSSGVALGSAAFQNVGFFLQTANALAELTSVAATARGNINAVAPNEVPTDYGANVFSGGVGSSFFVWGGGFSPGSSYSAGAIGAGSGTWLCQTAVGIGGWGGSNVLFYFTRSA
jgi:hypothetical protein